MKSLIVMPYTVAAIFITYFSINNTSYLSTSDVLNHSDEKSYVIAMSFCPTNRQIIIRDLRSEGIITKIQAQSIKTTSLINIQSGHE
jgi:hypothetical protein